MKRKMRSWPLLIVLLAFTAFLLWFFWGDVEKFIRPGMKRNTPEQVQKPAQEKILEEDRKKLEEILKRR